MPDSVITTSMRGRPSVCQRHQHRAGRGGHSRRSGARAHQGQRLGDRPALALEVVGAPQHQRERFRQRVAVVGIAGEQLAGLALAVLHREGARDAEGIEAVHVAARRQHGRRAQKIAAGDRPHVAPVQRVDQRRQFVVYREQPVRLGELAHHRAVTRRRRPVRAT